MDNLNNEQRSIIDAIIAGKNVFMTGCGGTGKTYTIKTIMDIIPAIKIGPSGPWRICLTALTGCAAILLGGSATTLHSHAGIGLGEGTVPVLVERIRKNPRARKRWTQIDMLIVDEVSMLHAELFEKLNEIGKILRRCTHKPFGGIQLLFVGDFYQLPPIIKGDITDDTPIFAFESPSWPTCFDTIIELKENHRQRDPQFQKMLQEARVGYLSTESSVLLKSRQGIDWKCLRIRPTLLFPRRREVDDINEANLKALPGVKKILAATIENKSEFRLDDVNIKRAVDYLDKESTAYQVNLVIAKDAQVMLTYNIDIELGLVNGSRGVVLGIDSLGAPVVEFMNGYRASIPRQQWELKDFPGIYRVQYPLRLAYAITIHKCQGSTLDCALIDIGPNIFEYGQAYVALSRVRSLDSLYVYNFTQDAIMVNTRVQEFYKKKII